MKLLITTLFISTIIFSYSGYSGLYYDDGLTLNGGYIIVESDEHEKHTGLNIGFSYLEKQAPSESLDKPTLFQSGILEMSGFYKAYYASYDDGVNTMNLNQKMGGASLNFHIKNLKFGYNYESYIGATWDINNADQDVEVSGYKQFFSCGISHDLAQPSSSAFEKFNMKVFLDFNIASGELELDLAGIIVDSESFDNVKAAIIGIGFQRDNFVIQPSILIPEDDGNKEVSISLIYKL